MKLSRLGICGIISFGSSGGALVAINMALEKPEMVNDVVADSFEGVSAKPDITEQIRV